MTLTTPLFWVGDIVPERSALEILADGEPALFIEEYFTDIPIMKKIAYCESRNRQYREKGGVLRGEINPDDVGIMQINEYYHAKTADRMELDLYTITGNTAYARYLYEKEGTQPWSASKKCWGGWKGSKLAFNG